MIKFGSNRLLRQSEKCVMSPLKAKKDLQKIFWFATHMAAKQKTCANELSLINYVPITERSKVQQPQIN